MTELNIEPRKHAKISPSSLERAMKCTMSVHLTSQVPQQPPNIYAATGTAGHAIFERCLLEDMDTWEIPLHQVVVDGFTIDIDVELMDHVQEAVDWVRQHMPNRDTWQIEKRLSGTYAGEKMWGFVDVMSRFNLPEKIDPTQRSILAIIDLKMGRGVVKATSPQLRGYLGMGLGITNKTVVLEKDLDQPAGVTVILQPRTDGPLADYYVWTWREVLEFHHQVTNTFQRLKDGDYTYSAGSWCTWCAAAAFCKQLEAAAFDATLAEVVPTPELLASGEYSIKDIRRILEMRKTFDVLYAAAYKVALDYMVHGGTIEDWQLSRTSPHRRWKYSDDEVKAKLKELGIKDPYAPKKLKSPNQAEKAVAKDLKDKVSAMAVKPEGELQVVSADSGKPSIEVVPALRAAVATQQAQRMLASAVERSNS